MSIDDLRKNIDDIDTQIVRLIAERIRIAEKIGEEKRELGKTVVDITREQMVLRHIRDLAQEAQLNADDIERVYHLIMAATRGSQGIFVSFQGETGAYSEEAAYQYFGTAITPVPCNSIEDVFITVGKGETQYGIIPVENSLEGSVSQSYDLLADSDLKVCGETELRVIHCLIASNSATLETIRKVYSHPQALAQCRAFLKRMKFELIPTYDTAGSVKMIKQMESPEVAAIASARAADIYGMKIIIRGIEDNPYNFTRFFILARQDSPATGDDKTSIVFSVTHKPGSLSIFLNVLAEKKINLTKVESRPTRRKPWEYNFYLDFEGHHTDPVVKEALEMLEEKSIFLKLLGSYPKYRRR